MALQTIQVADKPTLDLVNTNVQAVKDSIITQGTKIYGITAAKHAIWLNDYKTYGIDSYVYNNKDILHELYKDYDLSMNDTAIADEVFNYILELNTEVGKALSCVYGISDVDTLSSLNTIDEILNNEIAINSISDNDTAAYLFCINPLNREKILNNNTAFKKFLNNEKACEAMMNDDFITKIVSDDNNVDCVCSSAIALNKLSKSKLSNNSIFSFLNKANRSTSSIKNFYKTLQDTKYFRLKYSCGPVNWYYDHISDLQNNCEKDILGSGFIAINGGYDSSYDPCSLVVRVNGSALKILSLLEPKAVDEDNVNCISMPDTTYSYHTGSSGFTIIAIKTYKAI